MNAQRLAIRLVLVGLCLGSAAAAARGDGGTVRLRERTGPYEITVFTAPTPLRAGPVDISVLVQDAASGGPIPDARVTVMLRARGSSRQGLRQEATSRAATNKLLRAALFELPKAGWWNVQVTVAEGSGEGRGASKVHFAAEAGEPLPHWVTLWPWIAWPALPVALYGLRRLVVRSPIDP